jgi:hypothetical protein
MEVNQDYAGQMKYVEKSEVRKNNKKSRVGNIRS